MRQYGAGTDEPREGSNKCEVCGKHVIAYECGGTLKAVQEHVTATSMLPCKWYVRQLNAV